MLSCMTLAAVVWRHFLKKPQDEAAEAGPETVSRQEQAAEEETEAGQ